MKKLIPVMAVLITGFGLPIASSYASYAMMKPDAAGESSGEEKTENMGCLIMKGKAEKPQMHKTMMHKNKNQELPGDMAGHH